MFFKATSKPGSYDAECLQLKRQLWLNEWGMSLTLSHSSEFDGVCKLSPRTIHTFLSSNEYSTVYKCYFNLLHTNVLWTEENSTWRFYSCFVFSLHLSFVVLYGTSTKMLVVFNVFYCILLKWTSYMQKVKLSGMLYLTECILILIMVQSSFY